MTPFEHWRVAFGLIAAHPEQFTREFPDWLEENFPIWERFSIEADKIWASGRTHYSARTIGEFLRHETAVRESPNYHGFKVNDHAWPSLARLYMLVNPERAGFFERRVGQSALRAA